MATPRRKIWSLVLVRVVILIVFGLTCWAAIGGKAMDGALDAGSAVARRFQALIERGGSGISRTFLPVIAAHAGRSKQAEPQFKALTSQEQTDLYTRLAYAKALLTVGEAAEAGRLMHSTAERFPQSPTVWYQLGVLHLRRGSEEQGAVFLKKASDIDPFFAPANYELARWAAACAKRDEAFEYARRVLAVEDPGSPLAEKVLLLLDKLIPENEP